jgi:hypothetical protein
VGAWQKVLLQAWAFEATGLAHKARLQIVFVTTQNVARVGGVIHTVFEQVNSSAFVGKVC